MLICSRRDEAKACVLISYAVVATCKTLLLAESPPTTPLLPRHFRATNDAKRKVKVSPNKILREGFIAETVETNYAQLIDQFLGIHDKLVSRKLEVSHCKHVSNYYHVEQNTLFTNFHTVDH